MTEMLHEIKRLLSEYEIQTITVSNFACAMEVYHSNQAFFLLTEGKEATYEDCIKDIEAIPPHFDREHKIYVSLWDKGSIIGVLDLLTGFPTPQGLWIGLLLIHGERHGNQYGRRIVTAVLDAAKIAGYEYVQLGVIDNNQKGIRFWHKQGFTQIRTTKMERDNANPLSVVVMEKRL